MYAIFFVIATYYGEIASGVMHSLVIASYYGVIVSGVMHSFNPKVLVPSYDMSACCVILQDTIWFHPMPCQYVVLFYKTLSALYCFSQLC